MNGINLYAKDFQREALAFIRFPVNRHHEGRQVVERVVKRRQRIDHRAVNEPVLLALDTQFGTLQHFHAGYNLLRRLEDGKLHLGAFLHRGGDGDVYLLADEHLNRVDGGNDGHLR